MEEVPKAREGADRIDDHQACVKTVVLLARSLDIYDIPKAIDAATRALEMGPYIDPTAWRANHRKLEEDREMLRAALPLWELVQKLKERRDGVPTGSG